MAVKIFDATRQDWFTPQDLYILDLGHQLDEALACETQLRRRNHTARKQLTRLCDTLKLDPNVSMLDVIDTLTVIVNQLDTTDLHDLLTSLKEQA